MESQETGLQTLAARVEKLERQNRWLRLGGLSLLLLGVSIFVMAQAAPSRRIEAEDFVLKDSAGMKRAELSLLSANPVLRFFDPSGNVGAVVNANGYTIFGTGTMTVRSGQQSNQVPVARMTLFPEGLSFENSDGKEAILLGGVENPPTNMNTSAGLTLFVPNGGAASATLFASQDGTALSLTDSNGFQAVLGNIKTVTTRTGEQHTTSAASLTLFDKDGKVLWSAP